MYRESVARLKVKIVPGKASLGDLARTFGPYGIQGKEFADAFNKKTKNIKSSDPVIVHVYLNSKKKYQFVVGSTPTSTLIKQAVGIEKASSEPGKKILKEITDDQVSEIAKIKIDSFHTKDIESIKKSIIGTAISMGINYKEK